jgi:hypothetical protein
MPTATTNPSPTSTTSTATLGRNAPIAVRPRRPSAGRTPQQRPVLRPGDRVTLTCVDGEYTGVVLDSAEGFIRLRDGAGWWSIRAEQVLAVVPLAPRVARPVAGEELRQAQARQADRILQRWP